MALQHRYEGKTLLITGCTGFIGKILLEKILRTLLNVHRVFVLIRAIDSQSAKLRLLHQVLSCQLFDRLRNIHGAPDLFQTFVEDKVVAVAGDISVDEGLGIPDQRILSQIMGTATIKFNEPYHIALGTNTKGALHVSPSCFHCFSVFAAYACGDLATKVVKEVPLQLQPPGQQQCTDVSQIESEFGLLQETIRRLTQDGFTEKHKTAVLTKLGMYRAKQLGWPNTYALTKAMAEMLLTYHRGDTPLVIIRPTIVESTLREPFPRWNQGNNRSTLYSFTIPYGKGLLKAVPADPQAIIDIIPADYVVNVIVAAVYMHCKENNVRIYHASSSALNPLSVVVLAESLYKYFKGHPWIDRHGNPVMVGSKLTMMTRKRFVTHLRMTKGIFLQAFKVCNLLACNAWEKNYHVWQKAYHMALLKAEFFEPFSFCKARFDSTGTENLFEGLHEDDTTIVAFDVKDMEWERYLVKVHFPGVVKYVITN